MSKVHSILAKASDRRFCGAVSRLIYSNPFLPERIEAERAALGRAFDEGTARWNIHPDRLGERSNLVLMMQRAEPLLASARERLKKGTDTLSEDDRRLYVDLVFFVMYHRYNEKLQDYFDACMKQGQHERPIPLYDDFHRDIVSYLSPAGRAVSDLGEVPHLFACFFHIRRAFHHIFTNIMGVSEPSIRLRAAVWQSIFTHDMRRYRKVLYRRMSDVSTLVTGPSGTGKELVARAIGLSNYVPFDPRRKVFTENFLHGFHALNLSALSPTLIESELFGHRKGSFTGATADRTGWFEQCASSGTVFLDEIGELDPAIQVKLLRVLETREFQRIGDTQTRRFLGKIVAATNRDLAAEMRARQFRHDLYYRLCSDVIRTPTLAEQLEADDTELSNLVRHLLRRMLDDETEVEAVAQESEEWIERELGGDYRWPGNVRELEQCVRNLLIRGSYRPASGNGAAREVDAASGKPPTREPTHVDGPLASLRDALHGELTGKEVATLYATWLYAQHENYSKVAKVMDVNWRTARAHVDGDLLPQFKR